MKDVTPRPEPRFAASALIDKEFQMTTEERMQYSLAQPGQRGALSTVKVNQITRARVQYQLQQLAYELRDDVLVWIRDLARTNPKQALEAYFELMQFSVPKLKSMEIIPGQPQTPARDLTLAELQAALTQSPDEPPG